MSDLRLLRHFERLIARIVAVVIVPVGHYDDCAAELILRLIEREFVPAGVKDRIVERCAAARAQSRESL